MKKRSFFFKIFLGNFFILVLLVGTILLSSFRIIRTHYIRQLSDDLKNIGIGITPSIKSYIVQKKSSDVDSFVKTLGKKINKRVTIILPDGEVIGDSEKNPELMENHKFRPEIKKALHGQIGTALRFSDTVKKEMLYVAIPIFEQKKIISVIRVSMFLNDINLLLNRLETRILHISLLIVLLSLLLSFLFSRKISLPIKDIVQMAQEVASGNFKKRIFLKQNDEIRDLAENFNSMAEQLDIFVKKIQAEKMELQQIISFLHEGLIVINSKNKIILFNESFKKIVKIDTIANKFFWEILRDSLFIEKIKDVQEKQSYSHFEITIDNDFYLCSISFIPQNGNTIAVFHNISEMKKVEKLKKEFVSNVSHELRTPLTTIQGFLETLDDEEKNPDKKHYIEIMLRNTHRLIRLVEDLLILSELEKQNFKLDIEDVQLISIIDNALTSSQPMIKEKNLTLIKDFDDDLPMIKGEPFRLEQVFINLLDNAIKYTDSGTITLSLKNENHKIVFSITDTGIGIKKEALPHIFERFYVVNKSRSRKSGGTGLGLSIVKHIVLLHNASIEVDSKEGEGTTIRIEFPA